MSLNYSLRLSHLPVRRRSGNFAPHGDGNALSSVRLVTSNLARTSSRSDVSQEGEENVSFNPTRSASLSNSPDVYLEHEAPRKSTSMRSNSQSSPTKSTLNVFTLPQAAASLLPISISSGFTYLTSLRPSSSIRSDSDRTLCLSRSDSGASGTSIDSGHAKLIPSIKTTEKFTNKWPRPKSLKNRDVNGFVPRWRNRKGIGSIKETVMELEEGYSLGLDKIDRWTGFKWCLMISVITVLCYGSAAMVCAILTWFRTWNHADIMYVADNDILILMTLAASILIFTALLGLTGTLLNSRPILATYTLLLWPALISMLAIGYTSYKRFAFSLDRKLNLSWSQYYTPLGRLMIQSSLRCCGYYDPLHEATISNKCYPRTTLPGCKGKLYRFERENLSLIWSTTFSIVPLHLINILVALLCANHVTSTFGKGITPKQYRLSELDLKADAEKILAEMKKMDIERVSRPAYSRASSSTVFREDREERTWLLEQDHL